MIIGDSTARGGYVFHPGSAVAPAADDGDNDNSGKDDLEYLDDAPINPTAVRAILSSTVTSASLTLDPQPHTTSSSSVPAPSTLISGLLPFNDSMDVDSMPPPSDTLPGTGAKRKQNLYCCFSPSYHPCILRSVEQSIIVNPLPIEPFIT